MRQEYKVKVTPVSEIRVGDMILALHGNEQRSESAYSLEKVIRNERRLDQRELTLEHRELGGGRYIRVYAKTAEVLKIVGEDWYKWEERTENRWHPWKFQPHQRPRPWWRPEPGQD